jgi:hypothetical protein
MIQNTKVIDNENKSSVKKRETWRKYVIDWQIFGKQMLVDGKHTVYLVMFIFTTRRFHFYVLKFVQIDFYLMNFRFFTHFLYLTLRTT